MCFVPDCARTLIEKRLQTTSTRDDRLCKQCGVARAAGCECESNFLGEFGGSQCFGRTGASVGLVRNPHSTSTAGPMFRKTNEPDAGSAIFRGARAKNYGGLNTGSKAVALSGYRRSRSRKLRAEWLILK